MKKLSPSSLTGRTSVVLLYEPDIKHIADLLATRPGSVVTFKCGDSEFESIEDLRQHLGEVLRLLKIEAEVKGSGLGEYGSISVDFWDDRVFVHALSGFELQFHQVLDLLRPKRRLIGRIPDWLWGLLGSAVAVLGLMVLPAFIANRFGLSGWQGWVVYLPVIPVVVLLVNGKLKLRRNLLFLKKQHEHQGFFRRNEENIVRGVISIVSAAVGAVIGYLLKK